MLDRERMRWAAEELAPRLEGRRVAVAESCTIGLIAESLGAVEGASDWFLGGIVAYRSEVKFSLLGVPPGPVVNETVAQTMAQGTARLFDADVTLATTGAAGPAGLDGAAPGTVCIGWCVDGTSGSITLRMDDDAPTVARATVIMALTHLTAVLDAHKSSHHDD